MVRTVAAALVTLFVMVPSARAAERPSTDPVAPTPAVAAAWKQDVPTPSPALRALFVSYGAVQALDMVTTIKARNSGAIEANPAMQGSFGAGMAAKAALGAATMFAVHSMGRKHKTVAILTMVGANVATAMVAAHNMRVANELRRR